MNNNENQHEEPETPQETKKKLVLLDRMLADYKLSTEDIPDAVELYYDAQRLRILHYNKDRTEDDRAQMRRWFNSWLETGEKLLKRKIEDWLGSEEAPLESKWAYDQDGIGPVLASGLSAYIDVTKAPTVSSLWKFAGLAPGSDRRVKGKKLPYCARLKVLCFKLGESFVKISGKEGATYGRLYAEFKQQEVRRNEEGKYAAVAVDELRSKNFRDDTVTKTRLLSGKLSDAHLHARAKRRVVKIFLQHFWQTAREARNLTVNAPYAGQILGHTGIIKAKSSEQPRPQERAIPIEKPKLQERAITLEKTKKKKRAKKDEKPNIDSSEP